MELSIRLVEAFLEEPEGVLSIHQLSKKLKIPYGTAYNRTHRLQTLGVIQMLAQGKAKLCALNPDHPMTAALLGLGAAQELASIMAAPLPGPWIAKIRDILEEHLGDHLLAGIILNKGGLLSLPWKDIVGGKKPGEGHPTAAEAERQGWETLDLFLVTTRSDFPSATLETTLAALFPTGIVSVTHMAVEPSTLIGMLQEKENDAGSAAYQMLRRGLVLLGFEFFYRIILRAFPRRLS